MVWIFTVNREFILVFIKILNLGLIRGGRLEGFVRVCSVLFLGNGDYDGDDYVI